MIKSKVDENTFWWAAASGYNIKTHVSNGQVSASCGNANQLKHIINFQFRQNFNGFLLTWIQWSCAFIAHNVRYVIFVYVFSYASLYIAILKIIVLSVNSISMEVWLYYMNHLLTNRLVITFIVCFYHSYVSLDGRNHCSYYL